MPKNDEHTPPDDPSLLAEWIRGRLRKAAPDAVRSIVELATMADSEMCRLQASKDLLGLIGVQQKQVVEVDHGLKADQAEVDRQLEGMRHRIAVSREKKALEPEKVIGEIMPASTDDDTIVIELVEPESAD